MENACGALKEIARHPSDLVAVRLDALQQAELSIHLVECGVCQATLAGFCQQENSHTPGFKVVMRLCLMATDKLKRQDPTHPSLLVIEKLMPCEIISMLNERVDHFLVLIRSLTSTQRWGLIEHHAGCSVCEKVVASVLVYGRLFTAGDENNTNAQNAMLELLMTSSPPISAFLFRE